MKILRTYEHWSANPSGVPEDETRCVKSVPGAFGGMVSRQCARKRGYGRDGEYCKQHAKRRPAIGVEAQ